MLYRRIFLFCKYLRFIFIEHSINITFTFTVIIHEHLSIRQSHWVQTRTIIRIHRWSMSENSQSHSVFYFIHLGLAITNRQSRPLSLPLLSLSLSLCLTLNSKRNNLILWPAWHRHIDTVGPFLMVCTLKLTKYDEWLLY